MPASGSAGTAVISAPADSSDQLLSPLPGSLFLIVPVASSLVMESVWDASSHSRALLILTFTVSPLSFSESSMILTKGLSTRLPVCIHCPTFGRSL